MFEKSLNFELFCHWSCVVPWLQVFVTGNEEIFEITAPQQSRLITASNQSCIKQDCKIFLARPLTQGSREVAHLEVLFMPSHLKDAL